MERAEELAGLPTRNGPGPAVRTNRVLYIGGTGRSGSTLLEQALGQLPGIVSVGELRSLWRAILTDDRRCACGAVPSECGFWQEVGDRAFGGWRPDEVRSLLALQRSIDRHRRLIRLLGRDARHPNQRTRTLASAWSSVFGAIAETASARVVVDSSKYPIHAAVLRAADDLDLRIIHLVRDPRGVAFSWAKRGVPKPDATGDQKFMPVYGYGRTAAEWTVYNLAFDRMRRLGTPTLLLRYESFVGDPAAHLDRVLSFADAGAARDLSFVDGSEIALGAEQHAFGGNPQRLGASSTIHVQLDDAWRTKMPPVRRTQVSLVTLPLMVRYGYVGQRAKGVA